MAGVYVITVLGGYKSGIKMLPGLVLGTEKVSLSVLEAEPRALCMLGKCSSAGLHPEP